MLNQVILVGRIAKFQEEEEKTIIILAIPRSYKNNEGIYETDFIDCQLFGSIAKNTTEFCKNGDIVGIKGRIEKSNNETIIIADKITFLTSKKPTEEEKEEE